MYTKTADELMASGTDLAIIPVGSLEQHGAHLPIMTDWAIAMELSRRVAEKMGAFLLPALPVSTNREQMGKKGTVWMEPTTFYQMMTDMIMCLKLQGFKRVGIIQCHGGIFVMTPLIRDLNAKNNPDLMVALADTCAFNATLYQEGIIESNTELHAGEVETSQILSIAPQTVHMDKAEDFVPDIPRPYLNYGSIFRACPGGVWGEPTKATKEKGEQIFRRTSELAVAELEKAFAYMSAKEKFNYSNF